jgi:hypothetical protein
MGNKICPARFTAVRFKRGNAQWKCSTVIQLYNLRVILYLSICDLNSMAQRLRCLQLKEKEQLLLSSNYVRGPCLKHYKYTVHTQCNYCLHFTDAETEVHAIFSPPAHRKSIGGGQAPRGRELVRPGETDARLSGAM